MAADETIGQFFDRIKKELAGVGMVEEYANALASLGTYANDLNKTFTQSRQRISEMQYAIADAVPGVNRLGGSVKDVAETIAEIASASRRNVIANAESVEELYAASKILGTSAEDLTNKFLDVGVSFEQIGDQLETSISYVQSIGGNAAAVMNKVVANAEQLNRFQFEGGVQGLTKMAAQASMLRFNMNETFQLADRVLDPEKAVEVASAFQRLGVSAGNLVDPFQLMNQSINDPAGLQQSLIDVGKQFTYFDEKTKSFKINPQGVLTLRQIAAETGVSAQELSKAGLAAAELDARLTQIQPSLKFESEEDKQYLANIGRLGEGGKYEVKLKNESGDEYTKNLTDITQEELDNLIKEQKKGSQSIEEIQRNQLGLSEIISADVSAIKNKFVYGLASARPLVEGVEAGRRMADVIGGTASQSRAGYADVDYVRGQANRFYGNIEQLVKDISSGNKPSEALMNYVDANSKQIKELGSSFYDGLERYTKEVSGKLSNKTYAEGSLKEGFEKLNQTLTEKKPEKVKAEPLGRSLIEGQGREAELKVAGVSSQSQTMKIEIGGKYELDFKLPPDFAKMNTTQQKQFLDEIINSPKFKQYILDLVTSAKPSLKGQQNVTYQ